MVRFECLVQFSVTNFLFERSIWSKTIATDWLIEVELNKIGYGKLYQTFRIYLSLGQHTICASNHFAICVFSVLDLEPKRSSRMNEPMENSGMSSHFNYQWFNMYVVQHNIGDSVRNIKWSQTPRLSVRHCFSCHDSISFRDSGKLRSLLTTYLIVH